MIILFPVVVLILFTPVVLTGLLLSVIFQDYTSLTTVVAMAIWGFIYIKTETGSKIGDWQAKAAERILGLII